MNDPNPAVVFASSRATPQAGPAELPDPLLLRSGECVADAAVWPRRRAEIAGLLLPLAYGPLPPEPASPTRCVLLHGATVRARGGARLLNCRLEIDGRPGFGLRLLVPAGPGPFPVLLHGDACWAYADDAVSATVLARGYVLAAFNRAEVAPDPEPADPDLPLPHAAPRRSGTLAAWAWAYHRAVDALLTLDWVDAARIAVVGHSRGGKAALLAGATDTRIALTSANNSGAAGAGCWRWAGPGAESLADLLRVFPHWLGPGMADYAGRESQLPFDQHFLKALVAPRALLTTEAWGDLWANPQGSWQTHRAAACVYELLGAADRQAIVFRDGGHAHTLADWTKLLDFADAVFGGRAPEPVADPYPGLPLPARWMQAR